jgi:DNA invertase Pin-like site-specific DNA recombinase
VQLKKHGTSIAYVTMDIDTTKKEGWLLEAMLDMVDEFYSRTVADDTLRSMMKNAADGYYNRGTPPYG